MKDIDAESLIAAIHAAHEGKMTISPEIARQLFRDMAHTDPRTRSAHSKILSPRELEILTAVVSGLGDKEIATNCSQNPQPRPTYEPFFASWARGTVSSVGYRHRKIADRSFPAGRLELRADAESAHSRNESHLAHHLSLEFPPGRETGRFDSSL